MNGSVRWALAALALASGAAWSAGSAEGFQVFGRAGVVAGSERNAYVAETARPPGFDEQLRFVPGNGRAGGPAEQALARLTPALRRTGDYPLRAEVSAYGRMGYVPAALLTPARTPVHHPAAPEAGSSAERGR